MPFFRKYSVAECGSFFAAERRGGGKTLLQAVAKVVT